MRFRSFARLGAAAAVITTAFVAIPVNAAPSGPEISTVLDADPSMTFSTGGDPSASAQTNKTFNDFPSTGADYLVLSTGKAADVFSTSVPNDQPSTDFGANGQADDKATLTVTIPSRTQAACLLVDFAMGTEERVHTYSSDTPSDQLSVTLAGDDTEYGMNAGTKFFGQGDPEFPLSYDAAKPVPYKVNEIDYWHAPGDKADPDPGTVDVPRLPLDDSPIDHFTSLDTVEVPLPASTENVVDLSIADVSNGSLDSVAFVDNVRLKPSCSYAALDMAPDTGVATDPFVIVGHRGVGNELTVDPILATQEIERYDAADNGWFAPGEGNVQLRFRWYRAASLGNSNCYSTVMADWRPIDNADRQSFVPTNLEKGRCVIALVTGIKDGYQIETFPSPSANDWNPTLTIQDGIFDGQPPTITGNAIVGGDLAAKVVEFSPRPDSYAFQWRANGAAIPDQTGETITLTSAQAGKTITVSATGMRSGFDSLTQTSAPFGPVALQTMDQTSAPTIVGTPEFDRTLSVDTGIWLPTPVSFTYQWKRNDEVITGAKNATYKLVTADVGKNLTVEITGAKAGYDPVTRVSASRTVALAPLDAGTATITGMAIVNGKLTAAATGWPSGTAFVYTWKVDGSVSQSSTVTTFTVPATAAGKDITVTVRGSKAGYVTTDVTSDPTEPVSKATLIAGFPTIAGTLKTDQLLTATVPTWTTGAFVTYEWRVDGVVDISSTAKTFTIPASAVGKRITFTARGSKEGYHDAQRVSAETAPVGNATLKSYAPTFTGTAAVDQLLTASTAGWTTGATMTYEWRISGLSRQSSSAKTFKIPRDAANKEITLVARGSKAGYDDATVPSIKVATVKAGTLTSKTVAVSGTLKVGRTLTAKTAAWTPSGVRYAYRWRLNGRAVAGTAASKRTWKIPKSAKGRQVSVTIAGVLTGYTTYARTSAKTAKVR